MVGLDPTRDPYCQSLVHGEFQVLDGELILTLVRPAPANGNEVADLSVGDTVFGEQHQMNILVQVELAANNQFKATFLGGNMCLDHACH